ncbi:hypothetical protein [Priestia aryabhattai]|uniref:hypothetical protein n=1 Tax=Priestia aryabhattai TaxID=412384 RepID=UPI003D2C61FE
MLKETYYMIAMGELTAKYSQEIDHYPSEQEMEEFTKKYKEYNIVSVKVEKRYKCIS